MINRDAPAIIYNLFPRHLNTIASWSKVIPHVKEMAFTGVFVNPFHETGFSGSLYAVKDYFRLNPLFLGKNRDPADLNPIAKFAADCAGAGLLPIMDLVINHTAIDSPLVQQHAAWYQHDPSGAVSSPFAIDPGDPGKKTVWGDLATIDNEKSPDREALWHFWDRVVETYQTLGMKGFRADAAYQVPASLWKWLIERAKRRDPDAVFYAETLGCRLDQIEALRGSGFDYLFNSVRWWWYDQSWALDQHAAHKHIAPSIGFAESHDTERLASLQPGNIETQKSRYAFAAVFSKGLLMPAGFEYGAVTRMDVVNGKPGDVDSPKWDLTKWIGSINRLKLLVPVLSEEGGWRPLTDYGRPFIFLEKASDRGNAPVWFCINKQTGWPTSVDAGSVPGEIRQCSRMFPLCADTVAEQKNPGAFSLGPAEILMFIR